MPNFSDSRDDLASRLGSPVRGPTASTPATYAEDVRTSRATRDGDNDLESIIRELLDAGDAVENLTAFPDVDDYDDDAIILVNDSWYFKQDGQGIAANTFTGQHDDHYQTNADGSQDVYAGSANNGAWPEFQGTTGFRHNPNGALSYLLAINGTGFRLGIRKSIYEAAKGSAVAAGDQVTLVITYGTSPAESETVTFTYVKEYDNHYTDTGHIPYLDFAAPVLDGSTYRMPGTPNGTVWSAIVYAGATTVTPLLTHEADLVHWQAYTDNGRRWLRDRVNENVSQIGEVQGDLARVKRATADILVGEKVVPGWAAVAANGTEGGLWFSNNPTLNAAKAATYSAPRLAAPSGGAFYVARIPAGSDPRQWSMREPSEHFGDIDVSLNETSLLGSDDDWDYYEERVRFFGNITLRHSSHTVGFNTWGGKIGQAALEQVDETLEDSLQPVEESIQKNYDRLEESIQENYELLHKTRDVKDVSSLSDLSSTADGALENLIAKEVQNPVIPAPLSGWPAERWQSVGYERGVYEVTELSDNAATGTDAATINRNSFLMRIDKFEDDLYTTYGAATHHSLLAEVDGDLGRFLHNPMSAIHAFVADNDLNFFIWIKEAVIEAWRGGAVAPNDEDVYYNVLKMQEPDGTVRTKVFAYPWHDTTATKAVINGVNYRRMASDGGIDRASNWLRTLFENNPGDSDAEKAARTVRCWFSHSTTVDGTLSTQPRNVNIGDGRYPAYLGNASKAWTMVDPDKLDVNPAVAVLPPPPTEGSRNDKAPIYDGDKLEWKDFVQAVQDARQKVLIGTLTSANNTLASRSWTVPNSVTNVRNHDRAGVASGSDWLEWDEGRWSRADMGWSGILIETVRGGDIVTSVKIPFVLFRTVNPKVTAFHGGLWEDLNQNDKRLDVTVESSGNKLRMYLTCGAPDDHTTIHVYMV